MRRDNERSDKYRHRRCCSRVCAAVRRNLAAAARKAGVAANRPAAAPRVFPSGWPTITDPGQERLRGDAFAPYELRFCPQPGRLPAQPATALVRGSALDGEG